MKLSMILQGNLHEKGEGYHGQVPGQKENMAPMTRYSGTDHVNGSGQLRRRKVQEATNPRSLASLKVSGQCGILASC